MNNIMKKGLLLLATAFIAQFASAGLLYWSVDSSATSSYEEYAYAAIYSTSSSDGTSGTLLSSYIYGDANGSTYSAIGSSVVSTVAASVSTTITSSTTGLYFYVELLNSSMETIATSSTVAASDLATYYTSSDAIVETYTSGSYSFSSFTAAVPEPTGGLLILMGAAVLGLRRKRMA